MRRRLTPLAVAVAAATVAVALVGPPAAQAQEEPPTHGNLLPGGAGVGAGDHSFTPGEGGAEVPPSGYNTNRECWLEYGQGGLEAQRVSRDFLATEYERVKAAGGGKLPVTRVCQDIGGGNPTATPLLWPIDGDTNNLVPPTVLRDMAKNRLWYPRPVGDTSPSLGTGTFAQLPTFFWVSNMAPGPTARAEAGAAWAEVRATGAKQTWTIADSRRGASSFSCDGPGVQFDPSTGADPPAGACSWQPPHSSAGQQTRAASGQACFPMTVTITWDVEWRSSQNGAWQFLGTGTSEAGTCIVVQEIQAVVTDG